MPTIFSLRAWLSGPCPPYYRSISQHVSYFLGCLQGLEVLEDTPEILLRGLGHRVSRWVSRRSEPQFALKNQG